MLLRLQGLVEAAAKGQLLDPKQKDPKQKVTTEDPQPCQPSLSESWTTVSRKKKQQSSRTSKGEGKGVSEQSLKLRAHDWPSHRVVRTAFEFGHMLDKEGSEKPLVFLASSQDELVEACELVKGDSKVKATVLVQSTSEPSVSVSGSLFCEHLPAFS